MLKNESVEGNYFIKLLIAHYQGKAHIGSFPFECEFIFFH